MRRPALVLPVLAFLLALAGCEQRQPVDHAAAISYADDLQRRDGADWGAPLEVLGPDGTDALGHRWWQLRYADQPGDHAGDRIIIVDAESGWAQHPYPGYAVRVPAALSKPSSEHPLTVQEGPWILLVTDPAVLAQDRSAELEREVSRLNALGAETGLYPAFSIRADRQGRSAVVYGWQGDRGIQQDARVGDWLSTRTAYGRGTWVDLRQ
jgi:hypothetical protein